MADAASCHLDQCLTGSKAGTGIEALASLPGVTSPVSLFLAVG